MPDISIRLTYMERLWQKLWRFLTPLTIYVIWLTFIVSALPHNLGGSECVECLAPLQPVSGWRRAGQGGRAGPGIDHAATGDRMGQNSLWPHTSHYGGSGRGLSSCGLLGSDHRAPSTHSRQRPAYGKINVSFNQNFPRLPPQKSDLWTQEWLFKMCNLLAGGWCVQLYLLRQPPDPFMSPVPVWRPSPVLTFPSTLKPQIEGIILLVLDK